MEVLSLSLSQIFFRGFFFSSFFFNLLPAWIWRTLTFFFKFLFPFTTGLFATLKIILQIVGKDRSKGWVGRSKIRSAHRCLFGATEGFIRLPFLVEGIIQGFAGAVISLGLLGAVHTFLATRADQPLLRILHIESFQFLPPVAMTAIITGGMLLGGLGSLASVGRHSR